MTVLRDRNEPPYDTDDGTAIDPARLDRETWDPPEKTHGFQEWTLTREGLAALEAGQAIWFPINGGEYSGAIYLEPGP